MIMRTRFHVKPEKTSTMSQTSKSPILRGKISFQPIDDPLDTNPSPLSVAEQFYRCQLAIRDACEKLGSSASNEEFENYVNRALRWYGIFDMRAVVSLHHAES